MYIKIDDSLYESLDDDFKSKLEVYEPEDTEGLKTKANEILGEKKKLEADLAQAQADLKAEKSKKSGDGTKDVEKFQSQLDDAMRQLDDWKGKYNDLQTQVKQKTIQGEASKIAASLTKDTARANLLSQQIMGRLDVDNDKITVLDESGNPTVSSVDDLTSQIKSQYPFLVDGSQASGGGANGHGGGAAKSKTISRSEFDSLGHAERASFFRDGGTVTDD